MFSDHREPLVEIALQVGVYIISYKIIILESYICMYISWYNWFCFYMILLQVLCVSLDNDPSQNTSDSSTQQEQSAMDRMQAEGATDVSMGVSSGGIQN